MDEDSFKGDSVRAFAVALAVSLRSFALERDVNGAF